MIAEAPRAQRPHNTGRANASTATARGRPAIRTKIVSWSRMRTMPPVQRSHSLCMTSPSSRTLRLAQRCHHLIGDQLYQASEIHVRRHVPVAARLRRRAVAMTRLALRLHFAIAAAERVVAAQVTVLALRKADIVVTQALFQIEQLPGL